jgi:NAD-dependent dihydropyrimidine dehydrogenase PreA subunit
VWVLVQTARTGRLIFEDWDPYYNLFRIWTDGIALTGYVVVAATLLASLFIPRAFSRYACPLGAFNGFFNSFSFLGIERDAATCTSCGRCDKACPVNIVVSTATSVRNVECTRCLKCVEACPINARTGATLGVRSWMQRLRPSGGTERRALPRAVFAGVAVAAFVLPILITNISGDFVTTGGGGGGGGGTGSGAGQESGEAGGVTQSIRGRTTLAEIEGMVADFPAFLEEFGIPETEPPDTMLRDLTEEYGFDMEEIRAYVARNGP